MLSHLKHAIRQLTKSPGFTLTSVLTLALGIGACTAIFTVVNSVLLRPIAYPESERLMVLQEVTSPKMSASNASATNLRDWIAQSGDVFEGLYATKITPYNLAGTNEPIRLNGLRATGNYFKILRQQPALGRFFGPAEDAVGQDKVVVLSHAFWQKQFGGRHEVLNTTIRLDGQSYTVIGVTAPTFQPAHFDLYVPMALSEEEWGFRGWHVLNVVGRLKVGVPVARAQALMDAIAARLARQYPDTNKNRGVRIKPMLEFNTGHLRPIFYTLLAAVTVLLLIACANVANLLLARASARQREISVRAALGASRGRIVGQLLGESLLLALLGGGLGIIFARWGLTVLLTIAPADLPRLDEISVDLRAFGFAFGLSILTGLVFGLAPAWQSSRINLVDALKDGTRGSSEGKGRHLFRNGLVVVEIALALVLLAGAGLLIRSFSRLAQVDLGFNPSGALLVNLSWPQEKYGTPTKQMIFADAVVEQLKALPGAKTVAMASNLPFSGGSDMFLLEIEGKTTSPNELPVTSYFAITPDYFKVMGIPLLRGRTFTAQDRAGQLPVAIVGKSLADQLFPGEDPIGKHISMTNGPQIWREIVGVVGDVKNSASERGTAAQSYEPFAQHPGNYGSFVIRIDQTLPLLTTSLRQAIHSIDPEQPISRIDPVESIVADSMARQRFAMILFGVFSSLALLLASIGIYGVIAYSVTQRTGEFGIRMALGAQPADVLRLVLKQGARLIGLGLVGGLIGAFATLSLLRSLLYQTSPYDPLTIGLIVATLGIAALFACWLPARRATKVDPMVALRSE